MQLIVKRNDSTIILCPEPEFSKNESRYLLGILVAQPPTRIVKYSLTAAIPKALDKSWEYTTMIFDILGKLISNEVSPKQLAGPVGIIQMSGVVALGSFVALLNFMALIGINLGVLNLFPLIITDGGVLLFLLYESIRGKPLSLKAQAAFNRAAIIFFIMLFVYVTFNDIMRIPELLRMGR
jgi:regulator of sigma E protease